MCEKEITNYPQCIAITGIDGPVVTLTGTRIFPDVYAYIIYGTVYNMDVTCISGLFSCDISSCYQSVNY